MSNPFDLIFIPFAWVLRELYFLFHSYGVAVIIFCLISKVVLFPLSLKGKKSMIKMNALSSRQQQLQKQYGKDKARLNAEIQKLYEKEKVNPMGGCLWSLLPLPILIGLYGVIQKPLTYLMNLTSDEISELSNYLYGSVISTRTGEITIAEELFHRLQEVMANMPAIKDKLFSLDFSFLGINLAATPQWNPTKFDSLSWGNIGLFLIPIVSALLAYASMQISLKTNKTPSNTDNPMANTKTMMYTMPLISLWIGFTLPASLGIYWIANNVFTMGQELLAGRILKKDFEAAAREAEERELREKEEEKERKRLAAEERAKTLAEGKKKKVERKVSGEVLASSRSGIRAYARGRNYDPDRYGGVVPYREPGAAAQDGGQASAVPEETAAAEFSETARIDAAADTVEIKREENTVIPADESAAPADARDSSDEADYEAEAEESDENQDQ